MNNPKQLLTHKDEIIRKLGKHAIENFGISFSVIGKNSIVFERFSSCFTFRLFSLQNIWNLSVLRKHLTMVGEEYSYTLLTVKLNSFEDILNVFQYLKDYYYEY